ncbi:hypothetical protein Cadr_000001245 [Camelus dromedarius]|uniref:Uncharacterized protein n=1 Tax=Camelus dromedarius TaxID=9838 RepID=A0A5N4EKT5_CAMDR|nr:hypothetical protein Cadr_000001245 [Camelus dromedarius]
MPAAAAKATEVQRARRVERRHTLSKGATNIPASETQAVWKTAESLLAHVLQARVLHTCLLQARVLQARVLHTCLLQACLLQARVL